MLPSLLARSHLSVGRVVPLVDPHLVHQTTVEPLLQVGLLHTPHQQVEDHPWAQQAQAPQPAQPRETIIGVLQGDLLVAPPRPVDPIAVQPRMQVHHPQDLRSTSNVSPRITYVH